MTISELIVKLTDIKARRGDLDVLVWDDWDKFPLDHISIDEEDRAIVIQTIHGGWSTDDDA